MKTPRKRLKRGAGQERERVFFRLMGVMDILHGPDGCPWDKVQTRPGLMPKFREEVEEYAAAVAASDEEGMAEELGDLLLLVLFHARIAEREGVFDIIDVMEGLEKKLRRRHPHVFGGPKLSSPADVVKTWNAVKKEEKSRQKAKGQAEGRER